MATPNNNAWYRCSSCRRAFPSRIQLIAHMRADHRVKLLKALSERRNQKSSTNNKMIKIENVSQRGQVQQALINGDETSSATSSSSSSSATSHSSNHNNNSEEEQFGSVEKMNVDESIGAQINEMFAKIMEEVSSVKSSSSQEPSNPDDEEMMTQPPPLVTSDGNIVLETTSNQCDTMQLISSSTPTTTTTTTTTKIAFPPIIISVHEASAVPEPFVRVSVIVKNPAYRSSPPIDNKPHINTGTTTTTSAARRETDNRNIELIVIDDDDEEKNPQTQTQKSPNPSINLAKVDDEKEESTARQPITYIVIDEDEEDNKQGKLVTVVEPPIPTPQIEPKIEPAERQLPPIPGSTQMDGTLNQNPAPSVSAVADEVNLSNQGPPPERLETKSDQSAVPKILNAVGTQTESLSDKNMISAQVNVPTEVPPTGNSVTEEAHTKSDMPAKMVETSTQVSPTKFQIPRSITPRPLPLMLLPSTTTAPSAEAEVPPADEYKQKEEQQPGGYVPFPKKEEKKERDHIFRNIFGQPGPKGEFKCPTCSRSFSAQWALKEHERYHKELAHLYCKECDRVFQYKCNLDNHIRSKHTQETPYQCCECEKKFKLKQSLKSHFHSQHSWTPVATNKNTSN